MKTLRIDVPDELAQELERLVAEGWFASEAELVRLALARFVRRHRLELDRQAQREDIAWALRLKRPSS